MVVERELRQFANRPERVQVVHVQRLLGVSELTVGALQHGYIQLLFTAKVVVDHALGGARAVGNVVDPCARVATLRELGRRNFEDFRSRPFRVTHSLGRRIGPHCMSQATGSSRLRAWAAR